MPSTRLTDRDVPAVVTHSATSSTTAPLRRSRLPAKLRLPILIVLSLALRSALWSAAAPFAGTRLGEISKHEEETTAVVARVVYKIFTLWAGWTLVLDHFDISAATAVAHTPYAYLLVTYYQVPPQTVALLVVIEVISTGLPTYLLQRPSAIHNPRAALRNRFLIDSFQVQQSTNLLAIGVYVTIVWCSLKTNYLNKWLVSHFDVPTVGPSYDETVWSIAAKVFAAGVGAKSFLLNPSIGAETTSGTATPVEPFDPATADLPATLKHNFRVKGRRTRTLLGQTTILSAFIVANTVQRILTLEGTDVAGAAGYAGIWVFATVVNAAWWSWIGDTEA